MKTIEKVQNENDVGDVLTLEDFRNEVRLAQQRNRAKNAIKVRELCNMLTDMPSYIQDLPVVIDYNFVEDIRIIEDFPLGDTANPYGCEYCKVVQIT